jgi:ferric-dicitrate binding protein FerR (iron transport regulator)
VKREDIERSPEDPAALAAQASLRALVEQPVPSLSRAQARHLEQRIAARVEKLAAAARARAVRRRPTLGLVAAIAAALAAVATGIVLFTETPGPARVAAQVTALKGPIEIGSGAWKRSPPPLALVPVAPEEELRTGAGALARASLATGTAVEVGPSTRVTFATAQPLAAGLDETIALQEGRVSLDVPPLPRGVTLSVRTADATITVHGTRFSVERGAGLPGQVGETRVSVAEGRVAVHAGEIDRVLTRGQTWSSREAQAPVDAGLVEAPPAGTAPDGPAYDAGSSGADPGAPGEPPAKAGREPSRAPARTTLAAENALLQEAMEARRRGQPRRAIERIDRLLGRYPDSPLAEIARAERREAQETIAAGARERER